MLSIRNPEVEKLARELAARTGESLTQAVLSSLRERLVREHEKDRSKRLLGELREIRLRCAALPVLDPRTPDEVMGYDESGLPR